MTSLVLFTFLPLQKKRLTDLEIFQIAKDQDFTLVTFDEDFRGWQILKGFPPKIIWLRCGSEGTRVLANKIISHNNIISEFISDPDTGTLEVF